ncbi:C40 family peptidase [Sulfoacidibacillus thermotolerans]|uniref:NlpC/P60 domain-containing protein n=1 Tax=Sulfoacidibacillus thermotolerans TaxID=1765684 RepID=A0A2U3DCJ3_SULT2|nr:C40 family peptidase [Sulfoacidibacillus thermotolerans]PWI59001.1 hypothetical protein BM613_01335 [Sulfoacidibacillus thermotolerans]
MSKRNVRWLIGVAASLILVSAPLDPTYAESLSQEQQTMAQLQAEVTQTDHEMTFAKSQTVSIQTEISHYEQSLSTLKSALAENLSQMRVTEKHITELDHSIAVDQKQLSTYKESLRAQIRVMYENGRVSYLSVLLESSNWEDFLSRLYMLVTIAKADQHLLHEVASLKQQLVVKRQAQQLDYDLLIRKHTEYEAMKQADLLMEEQKNHMLAQLNQKIQSDAAKHGLLESQIQLTQSQIQKIELETEQAQSLVQNVSYIQQTEKNLPTVNVQSLLQYAESFMGTPYVWGGTSPSGFDCSGFTQYVFAHFGVDILRTSEQQFAEGLSVPENQLTPGDLVFFSTYAPGATHVGIYIGNNLMVDAQDYGVSIDNITNSYWGPKYIGARQILAN